MVERLLNIRIYKVEDSERALIKSVTQGKDRSSDASSSKWAHRERRKTQR